MNECMLDGADSQNPLNLVSQEAVCDKSQEAVCDNMPLACVRSLESAAHTLLLYMINNVLNGIVPQK